MARRDSAGVRLITRQANDFTSRFPLIVAAVAALPSRLFLIDGEAICINRPPVVPPGSRPLGLKRNLKATCC
jgi:ATP-dependent DNA ligase